MPTARAALLACGLLVSAGAAGASAVAAPPRARSGSNALEELSRSTTQLWKNFKVSQAIRAEQKAGAAIDYADFLHLKRGAEDRGKLFQVVWYGTFMKWSTPLLFMIQPSLQPSTFETPSRCAKRFEQEAGKRTAALLDALKKADAGTLDQRTACEALSSGSKAKALALLTRAGAPLSSLPLPVVQCASSGLGGPLRFFPRLLHMRAIRDKLRAIEQGDLALRASRLELLPRATLAEACNERALRVGDADAKALRAGLVEWLALTAPIAASPRDVADTARIALLAINAASSLRMSMPAQSPAALALYKGGGF